MITTINTWAKHSILTLTLLLSYGVKADVVTIVSDRWFPYNGIPSSPAPGYMIEIARYGLEKAGHTVNYQLMSWDRSLQQVKAGQKTCLVGTTKSESAGFVFPKLHLAADQVIYIRPKGSSWSYNGIESLKDIKLGTIPGYHYSDDLTYYINHIAKPGSITETKGKFAIEKNITALTSGKIDVIVDSKNVLDATLKKLDEANKIEFAGAATPPIKLYIACSPAIKQSQEYVSHINNGLIELRANGKLNGILNKYGLTDWQNIEAIDN